ncbi:MAG: DUF481 domain-containing protein [Granulosicoccus sp.]
MLPPVFALVFAVSALFTTDAVAEEWSGHVEGGTVASDAGNRSRLRLTLTNDSRPFTQQVYAEWLRGGSDDGNAYAVGYLPRYWFRERYYLFGEGRLRVDDGLDIDRDIFLLGGVGGQFFQSERQGVVLESGLGAQLLDRGGEEDEEITPLGILRLGYNRLLSDMFRFDLDMSAVRSEELSELSAEAGLSMRIPTGAIRISYRSRSTRFGNNDRVSNDDTFVSFTYGF